MRRAARAALSAFAYFSVVPLGRFSAGPAPDPRSLTFLPLVGAVVGALAGLVAAGVLHAAGPAWATIGALAASLLLTGAIHFDGFLDSCDGLFVTATPDRRLEILRDPRHGTFAFTGGALAIAAWWVALSGVIHTASLPLAIAFCCALARLAAVTNAWVFPYARPAVTRAFAATPSIGTFAVMLLGVALLGWFLRGPVMLALIPCSIALALAVGWFASRRLGGGLTGDVYGFIVVIIEIGALAVLPAIRGD
ncbi:MAG: adenosylcobinamide-GDP ribazoletransferase [Vulcanimicrobiaceae bacterium]